MRVLSLTMSLSRVVRVRGSIRARGDEVLICENGLHLTRNRSGSRHGRVAVGDLGNLRSGNDLVSLAVQDLVAVLGRGVGLATSDTTVTGYNGSRSGVRAVDDVGLRDTRGHEDGRRPRSRARRLVIVGKRDLEDGGDGVTSTLLIECFTV
jgi:hypothetical protein